MYKNFLSHKKNNRQIGCQTVPSLLLFGLTLLTASPVWAQTVVIDGTTPTTIDTGVVGCAGDCIRGGINAGGNLFHSFTEFGVGAGSTVTFQDPGVTNIIGRVTGSNPSLINGTLGATGNANLFLFNPNGITFGTGATLSLGGSFIGSTASGITFQDGTFSLTDSSATNALLTVNIPTGLQVGTGAGDIVVNGTGNNLFINQDLSVVDALFTPDLAVNAQRTLALVGGNVTLDGANLSAPDGRVEIGSVGSGLVSLAPATEGFQLGYAGVTDLRDITLQNAAAVDVSDASAGTVQLRGRQVSLSGGSAVRANTSGAGPGGLVQVTADILSAAGASTFVPGFLPPAAAPFVVMPSGIFASVEAGATGSGSQINLNVGQLSLTAGAQVAASTFGVGSGGNPGGNAGNLTVNAETITVDGGRPAGPSGLFTTVAPGPAGDETNAATGNGGNLTITLTGPGELFVRNGGQISAGSFGVGNAGSLTVNANLIEVTGSFAGGGPSSLRSASERPWAGAGGTVDVTTNRLLVADGGQIVTGTLSTNPANGGGNLTVRASEQIDLRGGDASGQSGLFSSALIGPAAGGNITVETGNLFIRDGATISASNNPSNPASTLTSGTGPAGNVAIRAQNVTLDNGSSLNANTRTNVISDRNASITVNSQTLTLNNSRITTNATGLAPGGNVTATLSTLTMLGNSAITADSVNSTGGRITINTAILAVAPGSRITARSGLGADFDGVVEINETEGDTPEVQSEEAAPEDSQELIASCEKLTDNELVLAGAGGLPSDPTYGLTSQSIWVDTRAASEIDSVVVSAPAAPQPEDVPLTIVAAQGWATNDQGQIVLVAEPTVHLGETFVASHQSQYCGRG